MGSRQTCQTALGEVFRAFDMVFMLAMSGVISPVKNFQHRPDFLKCLKYYRMIHNIKKCLLYWAQDNYNFIVAS